MITLEKQYATYGRELRKLNEQKDALYTIASQKYSEGNGTGQDKAYLEIDAIQAKIDELANLLEGNLLGEDEGLLSFDS